MAGPSGWTTSCATPAEFTGVPGTSGPGSFQSAIRQTLVEATPPSRLRFDDAEAIADAAEAGHGLAWLPCWLIRDRVRSGTLIPLFGDVPSVVFVTHALWTKTPHLPLRVRFALDALTAALPGTTDL